VFLYTTAKTQPGLDFAYRFRKLEPKEEGIGVVLMKIVTYSGCNGAYAQSRINQIFSNLAEAKHFYKPDDHQCFVIL